MEMKHIKTQDQLNESREKYISDVSYDKDWDDIFNKVKEGLKNKPIHYKDDNNLTGEVYLKELYENYGIDFEDGLDQLVDLVAYLIDENGYKIIKK